MSAISIKQFDTARAITDVLKIGDEAIDLTGAALKFALYDVFGQLVVLRDAEIVDASEGSVQYQPVDDDVETAGDFEFEWQITFDDESRLTVPTEGRVALTIYPALIATS